MTTTSLADTVAERVRGSLLFDPGEKHLILAGLPDYGTRETDLLRETLDREDVLLQEALEKDGERITALIEGYISRLNEEAYRAKRDLLRAKEDREHQQDTALAEHTLSEA